ncbi:MAG TPA: hypothetical protein VKA02_02690 [Candidatus Acidoferrum sp.]|nr:hypothetical protein [Candidatus Acidoferrum sp.]
MKKGISRGLLFFGIALALCFGSGVLLAELLQQTYAGPVTQVFTLATSQDAIYSNSSGTLEPMPSTSLTFAVEMPSLLTISFSARGSVAPSGSQIIPLVFLACTIDGQACEPDTNTVEFLYPQFCCDTRSFQWVAHDVARGNHTVEILWGMGNPTLATVTNRSLIVEAAALRTRSVEAPILPR